MQTENVKIETKQSDVNETKQSDANEPFKKLSNGFYRAIIRRRHFISTFILPIFYDLCSWPRLLIEVFIRRDFGERYFSFSIALFVAILLAAYPILTANIGPMFNTYDYSSSHHSWTRYITWYLFIILFLHFSYKRHREIKTSPGVYDFARLSTNSGVFNFIPLLYLLPTKKNRNFRFIETILEPGMFFAIGSILALMGQSLGSLLVICSILYSLGYIAAYKIGDDYIMDQIDKMIIAGVLYEMMTSDDVPLEGWKGVRPWFKRPKDKKVREQLAKQILSPENDDVPVAK